MISSTSYSKTYISKRSFSSSSGSSKSVLLVFVALVSVFFVQQSEAIYPIDSSLSHVVIMQSNGAQSYSFGTTGGIDDAHQKNLRKHEDRHTMHADEQLFDRDGSKNTRKFLLRITSGAKSGDFDRISRCAWTVQQSRKYKEHFDRVTRDAERSKRYKEQFDRITRTAKHDPRSRHYKDYYDRVTRCAD